MSREFRYQVGDEVRTVTVEAAGDRYIVRVGDRVLHLTARRGANGRLDLDLDGRRLRAHVAADGQRRYVSIDGESWTLQPPDPRAGRRTTGGAAGGAGDAVQKGDTLVLLEAMKMELRIQAPADGQVSRVLCAAGEVVDRGQTLVELQSTS